MELTASTLTMLSTTIQLGDIAYHVAPESEVCFIALFVYMRIYSVSWRMPARCILSSEWRVLQATKI